VVAREDRRASFESTFVPGALRSFSTSCFEEPECRWRASSFMIYNGIAAS